MSDKKLNWNITKDEKIEDFKIFSLRKSTRINPRTDKPYTFLLMDGYDWVNLFALTTNKEIILVKQYRHGADCETLELPGGCIEPNEDPAASAKRELQEETGYSVSKIEPLGSLYANPALQSIRVHYYISFDAVLSGNINLDEGEDIITTKIPLTQFIEEVRAGKVQHALNVAAVGLLALKYPKLCLP